MFSFRSMPPNAEPLTDDAILDALRHTGMRLTRAVDAALDADHTPAELADLAATFERTGRGLRRTIAFAHHLAKPARDPAKHAVARRQIIRDVEDAIAQKATRVETEALRAELYERVEATEFDEDLDHLPPEQALAHILRDLGLANVPYAPPYPRRTPAELATLVARAARQPVPQRPPNDRPSETDAAPIDPYETENPGVDAVLAWDARKRARGRFP